MGINKKFRSKLFRLAFDDCETKILELLYENKMTFKDLERAINVHSTTISSLAYGKTSPVFLKTGTIKPSAKKICEFFYLELHDVFPRYACNWVDVKFKDAIDIEPETYSLLVANNNIYEKTIMYNEINCILSKLYKTSPKRLEIFYKIFFEGYTFSELSKIYCLSNTRIQQIYRSACFRIASVFKGIFKIDNMEEEDMFNEIYARGLTQ